MKYMQKVSARMTAALLEKYKSLLKEQYDDNWFPQIIFSLQFSRTEIVLDFCIVLAFTIFFKFHANEKRYHV